ncbi:MAG: TonB-dependent receptor [Gemmatimonadaceae bacterium]|nr:TonB-dependent receptor [Gemmatimonadaceae bacterium]
MVRRIVGNLLAGALLIAAARAAGAQGSLAGKVTDGDKGTPIASANVQVMSGLTVVGRAQTGDDGTYRVSGVADGTYAVVLTRIGYSARRIEGVAVSGASTANFTMVEFASRLNAVVTTANRGAEPQKELDIPASLSVVSADALDSKPAPTIAGYLESVPGLSVSSGGILQSNIVSRGFNNAFSGAMLNLQDYRFAGVPSLRVNVPALYTGTMDDIARIEVLNGPASSLYGPNSANGVIHIITKSPFESQGTSLSLEGGNQSLMHVSGRHAGVFGAGKEWGYKLSAEYFSAQDFKYVDPNEPAVFPSTAPAGRAGQPVQRDFALKRTSAEARLDYRPNDHLENILTAGYTDLGSAIEITTAFGAAQAKNWSYKSLQDRFKYKNFFAQVFWNGNNSGNSNGSDLNGTYYLRTGIPVVDKSNVLVGQVQQAGSIGDWKLVGGIDYINTQPRSEGTIFGRNEGSTDIHEQGAYIQGAYPLAPKTDLTIALRGDQNDRITGTQFSPRVAFTYKQSETANWRLTFSRAFNSPASFSFFLDQVSNPTQAPGFALRAIGNPPKEGWQFNRSCDASINAGLCMRSPFVPGGPGTAIASSPANAFPGFVSQLSTIANQLPASTFGDATKKAQFLGLLSQMMPILSALRPTDANVGSVLRIGSAPVAASSVQDAQPLNASFNNTWELGYKAILRDRVRLAVDFWYQIRGDVGAPIGQLNPLVFYDPNKLGAYLGAQIATALIMQGMPAAQAQATAGAAAPALTQVMAALPQGSVALNNARLATDQSIIATYTAGIGTIDVHGIDMALDWQVSDHWALGTTFSHQGKIVFPEVGGTINPLMSNSPKYRATGNVKYSNDQNGLTWQLGTRYSDAFPVNSGLLNSLGSPPNPAGTQLYPPIPAQTLFDMSASWRLPTQQNITWSVNVQNLLDTRAASFVGTAPVGRLALTRLQWSF